MIMMMMEKKKGHPTPSLRVLQTAKDAGYGYLLLLGRQHDASFGR